MDTENTKEHVPAEENIRRGRSDSMYSSHELTRMRTRYEEATEDYERARSRAEFRRFHGPPRGFGRSTSAIYDFWTHHISIIVPQDLVRDHLGMLLLFNFLIFGLCLMRLLEAAIPPQLIDNPPAQMRASNWRQRALRQCRSHRAKLVWLRASGASSSISHRSVCSVASVLLSSVIRRTSHISIYPFFPGNLDAF